MVGKPSLFCEDLGRQIHDPFLLAISRRQFCEPRTGFVESSTFVKNNVPVNPFRNTFRNSKQDSQDETEYREKRYDCTSQVQLGKAVLDVEQDTKLTYIVLSILMGQGWPYGILTLIIICHIFRQCL